MIKDHKCRWIRKSVNCFTENIYGKGIVYDVECIICSMKDLMYDSLKHWKEYQNITTINALPDSWEGAKKIISDKVKKEYADLRVLIGVNGIKKEYPYYSFPWDREL